MAEKYFLGCMTQRGFSTCIRELFEDKENYTYILKGGPGTGKSSLMKRAAKEFEPEQHVVRFYCSSDPDSLDAVFLEDSHLLIVDGTAPHVFDPVYPGACQKIIDLGCYWDDKKLAADKESIIAATDKNRSLHERAGRFSAALSNVCADSRACALNCIDEDKLGRFLTRFCKKILPRKGSGSGRRNIRQLSALTEFGYMTMTETLSSYIDVYIMRDEHFACSDIICERAADEAVKRGFDVILCPCHAMDDTVYEHLLIPETGTALVSATPLNGLYYESSKQINLARFYDKSALSRYRSRLKINKLTSGSIADEVYSTIRSAKRVHDEIERFYIGAMDFEKLDDTANMLISEIREK